MTNQLNKYLILIGLIINSLVLFAQEKITVEPAAISSDDGEYAPVYYQDGLAYSSVGATKEITGLYFAPFKKDKFGKKRIFSSVLKSGLHEGAITFSADGKIAYFTRTQGEGVSIEQQDSITEETKLGIYRTVYDGSEWSEATPCNFNTPEFSFGHPSLSQDGKRLYFTSDIEGGFGGKDIYYTEIKDGVCGPLVNMGNVINSAGNEFFPYIDPNNKLYFSSDKAGGYGGLDIYYSVLKEGEWSALTLMDKPINSEFDDFSIVWHTNAVEGYFASNRKGTDDIFKINIEYPAFENCVAMEKEQLCYDFYEEATVYVDSVEMVYTWNFGDGTTSHDLGVHHCYEKAGKYKVELTILDKVIGKEHQEEDAFELEIKEVFQPQINLPDSFMVGQPFSITVQQGKWGKYPIENFYMDYGDGTIVKNVGADHRYLSGGEKELKIMIFGEDPKTNKPMMDCFAKTINVINRTE